MNHLPPNAPGPAARGLLGAGPDALADAADRLNDQLRELLT